MNDYPARVTLFDDGVYRWSYDLDMWRNRYLLQQIVRILCIALGIPTLIIAAMVLRTVLKHPGLARDEIMFFIRGDLLALAVVGGIWIGTVILTLIVYAVCAAVMRGTWRLCFEMDDSAVALIPSAAAKKRNGTLATIASAVEIAALLAGNSDHSLRSASRALRNANESGTTRFDSVRRVKLLVDLDLIDLRQLFGMNQIYVNAEDYPFVRDFILERVRENSRP